MKKEKSAAIITIHEASKMTPKGRKEIADWMRNHAKWLVKYGKEYNKRFTGRYLYK